ncbi:MAG: amidohydrolase family protein [Gammaproteobacteria bacterium]|nr:amidohydrolase family protein [Gammaproteobacteria bacterium]
MEFPVISADSHITEHPSTYVDYIDSKWKDKAPRIVDAGEAGDVFVIHGMERPIPLGLVAAAGKRPEEITTSGVKFEELHRGGWDPDARMDDQARDGVSAEVIYPTVGLMLCNHEDFDYKKACFDAYNRWIAEYCSAHPDRLLGCGQTAMRSVDEGIEDLEAIDSLGLRGVMMPGNPAEEDYDAEIYNPFWERAIELGLPLSFHILTSRGSGPVRGPRINGFLAIIRANQDIMGTLIFGGVFERYPELKVVCVEADAGWVPHYMYRMDHAYKRHRNWLAPDVELAKLPSEYFAENIYTTFQDDWVAFRSADQMNWRRLMWANDFPHSDSTWPWSQEMLAEQSAVLTDEQRRAILCDNVAELYRIDLSALLSRLKVH